MEQIIASVFFDICIILYYWEYNFFKFNNYNCKGIYRLRLAQANFLFCLFTKLHFVLSKLTSFLVVCCRS